jgi:hypothetical protein
MRVCGMKLVARCESGSSRLSDEAGGQPPCGDSKTTTRTTSHMVPRSHDPDRLGLKTRSHVGGRIAHEVRFAVRHGKMRELCDVFGI